jgi:hypothetical protein
MLTQFRGFSRDESIKPNYSMIENFLLNKTKVLQCELNFNFSSQTPPKPAAPMLSLFHSASPHQSVHIFLFESAHLQYFSLGPVGIIARPWPLWSLLTIRQPTVEYAEDETGQSIMEPKRSASVCFNQRALSPKHDIAPRHDQASSSI